MILYVDASAGVSGDMLLDAMLDLGLPRSTVEAPLKRLGAGLPTVAGPLLRRIKTAGLPAPVRDRLVRVWKVLAQAEGESHGCSWRAVHFHQLSRLQTMRNIAGFCAGLAYFKVGRVYCGPVPMGRLWQDHSGRPRKEPGPSATRLLTGSRLSVRHREESFEWTTPTGAALLAAFVSGSSPVFRAIAVGEGFGRSRQPGGRRPLRLLLGKPYLNH